ncbi:MAG: STT3 domain-containing protein [Thermoplasmatota archaeon]|jgi:dolichyl-diphosphooligosaccharide--protein glycosyltransferase
MRKRAQLRSTNLVEPKHAIEDIKPRKKLFTFKKDNLWAAASLIFIFLLVLFLNSYFNITSGISYNPDGTSLDKFYLSGPDPYYNMRIVNETFFGANKGHYQFYTNKDPLLDYPIGKSGGRPPLLNMMAIAFSRLLLPFMNEIDAVGYSMQFVPALFGALLVFPVYFIGKTLFNKKAGLIAAFLIALIPIHLGSGHGSSYSLFDHDSLNLLLYFLAFLFVIKGIKEKDTFKSIMYSILAGVSLGALSMVWVEGQFLYAIISVYAVIQILIDIFLNKTDINVVRTTFIAFLVGYLISLPVTSTSVSGSRGNLLLLYCIGVGAFGLLYYIFYRKKIPWTISLPIIFGVGIFALVFLYFIEEISSVIPLVSSLSKISNILYGSGIYGDKVSMTIAEASTSTISTTVMSFGPALYWIAWVGFVFLIYRYYKDKQRRDYLFIIVLFLVDMWLLGTAGRFLNDLVPVVAILCGFVVWMVIDRIDYKQMIRNIRSAGGGLHGIRRGVKVLHIFGVLFVVFLVVLPNAYLALDAAVPANKKNEVFGDFPCNAFGLSHGKESYWVDAYNWLNKQDTHIQDPTKRPAFISWWDYGFYEVAVGAHPTVADNFQNGIPPAANFHTATSEEEAVSVWIVRLLEGNLKDNNGKLSEEVVQILNNSLGPINSSKVVNWTEDPTISPSYDAPIGEEYNEELSKEWRVGAQWPTNAVYHDVTKLLIDNLDDEGITWLYHKLQDATGYSIRYYGVEGYDKQIFNIFGFLADKSLLLVSGRANGNPEDDFEKVLYTGYHVNSDGSKGSTDEWSYDEIKKMSADQRKDIAITNTKPIYKDAYFDTMFYRTYIGPSSGESGSKSEPNYQLPCINMRHFCAEYASNITKGVYYTNKVPVIIAKYYEGAYINGTVTFMGNPLDATVVVQKDLDHYNTTIPIDHDSTSTVDGKFSLIAPAGAKLQVRRYASFRDDVILKNISFNSTSDPMLFPISDDDAMRRSTNYNRLLNISIDPANVEGYVYLNKDNNTAYNSSVYEPLPSIKVTLHELQDNGQTTIERASLTTDENGYFNKSGLTPGLYIVRAETKEGFIIHDGLAKLLPGGTYYNISKPKDAALEGTVYYDKNGNNEYDSGEEMSDVAVDLTYNKIGFDGKTIAHIFVDTIKTDSNGRYKFTQLVYGQYIINVTKQPDYIGSEKVTLEENKTTMLNISIGLKPVKVSGHTKYGTTNIDEVSIDFLPDESVQNNTAEKKSVKSDENGSYTVELSPGSYNVSVSKKQGQTLLYSFAGNLTLRIGEGTRNFDISLKKESVTVNGVTKCDGINVANISIDFLKDMSVKNNTAVYNSAKSDEEGRYIVELAPGTYNVSVEQTVLEGGKNVTYTFSRELVILPDETVKTFDIDLVKEIE